MMELLRAAAAAMREFFSVQDWPQDWDRQAWADRQTRLEMDRLAQRRES